MEKEFVPYGLALRMKQLGFDEPCFSYYMNGVLQPSLNPKDYSYFNEMSEINPNIKNFENVLAPTWHSAFRWFREKYGLYSWIKLHNGYINDSFYPELPITFSIMDRKTGNESYERDIPHNYLYKTNEEAELACLKKLCQIVENNK